MGRVVLHVGLPKTGTSFLQSVLRENTAQLARRGVVLPATEGQELFLAVLYLTGRSASWGRSASAGNQVWERVVSDLRGSSGTTVISSETLCLADAEQVERIVRDLRPHDIDVVLTVRDPARQLPAEWQEGIKHGRRGSYESFLDAVLAEPAADWDEAAVRRHHRFWAGQDPVGVLDRWGAHVPEDRLHVVTAPPAGAPVDELWRRFAVVLGVPGDDAVMPTGQVNVSLGATQLEVLRRVNNRFVRRGREQSYGTVAKRLYAGRILRGQRGAKVTLPPERLETAEALAQGWIKAIADRGWGVVGDLDDLRPVAASHPSSAADVTVDDMLESALDATGELLTEIERLKRENARLRRDRGSSTREAARGLVRRGRSLLRGEQDG